jgi:hypothetical protein
VAGWAAQPPEFSPRDVVGLTWSTLGIPPPSGLAALIHSFLEPNFPRRWSASNVGVDARPGGPSQPGRSQPNPAPGPPPVLSSLSFCLLGPPSGRSTSLPSPTGIENASLSRLLAAPLTTLFLVDLHVSPSEARTWKIGRGSRYEATNKGNTASLASVPLGGPQLR